MKPFPPHKNTKLERELYVVGVIILAIVCILLFVNKAGASELCNGWANQAEKIMTVRQEHMSLSEISARLEQSKDIPAAAKPVFTNLIAQAYQVPIYNKIQDKLDVIKKFSDSVLIDCLNKTAEKV